MKNSFFISVILLLAPVFAFAQSRVHSADTAGVSSFGSFGIRYKSDYYYMGRADSAKAPYLIPSVAYYHKSGLFISGSLSYLTAAGDNRVDLYTLSGGYDYIGKKFAAGISADQYFFSELSYSVQAEMSTYVSGYVGYDLDAFMVVANASLGVSDNLDVFLGGEISKTFYMVRDHLSITPSFYTNLGTQRYYDEYYTRRTMTTGGSGHGKGSGSASPDMTTVHEISILESEKFQVLDYELGIQMGYRINRFRFATSGIFLFPVNPSTVVTESTTYEEKLENGFVWSVGLRYRIGQQ